MQFRLALVALLALAFVRPIQAAERPNILVIVADDLGYSDVAFQGCKDIPTPHVDSLARRGLRCTNGYVSHSFCSPTRAGLLTGRYQQRFGHENNPDWVPNDPQVGLPLSQVTLPQVLKTVGYTTGCVGKWHLGAHPQFHPNRRGFNEYFGLLGGGHIYLPNMKGGAEYLIPLDRNGKPEPLEGYLTDSLGREAAAFVERHKSEPWFLYLTFNAPHTPLHVTDALLARVAHITDETRRKYLALILGMDDALGAVLKALGETNQTDNTLIFFVSDNGGPTDVTHSSNGPLRGAKGQLYEGGIRVPFLISWVGKLPRGRNYDQPVSSLDIFATAAGITGVQVPATHELEGVNLLPFLAGENPDPPHKHLFWRMNGGKPAAVREGRFKLLITANGPEQLYDLESDVGETRNLAAEQPETVVRLRAAYDAWNAHNIPPIFENPQPKRPTKAAKGKQA